MANGESSKARLAETQAMQLEAPRGVHANRLEMTCAGQANGRLPDSASAGMAEWRGWRGRLPPRACRLRCGGRSRQRRRAARLPDPAQRETVAAPTLGYIKTGDSKLSAFRVPTTPVCSDAQRC